MLFRSRRRGEGQVEFMAWTLGVIFEIVRSRILWESSEAETGSGGAVSEVDWVEAMMKNRVK